MSLLFDLESSYNAGGRQRQTEVAWSGRVAARRRPDSIRIRGGPEVSLNRDRRPFCREGADS